MCYEMQDLIQARELCLALRGKQYTAQGTTVIRSIAHIAHITGVP